jgi:hypothetical protein
VSSSTSVSATEAAALLAEAQPQEKFQRHAEQLDELSQGIPEQTLPGID